MKIIFLDFDGVLHLQSFDQAMYHAIGKLILDKAKIQQVGTCPSGALQFEVSGIERPGFEPTNFQLVGTGKSITIPIWLVEASDASVARAKVAQQLFKAHFCDPDVPFAPSAIAALSKITTAPREDDLRIVVISSWRTAGLAAMQRLWQRRGLPGVVYDVTPIHGSLPRGEEIQWWLDQHDDVTNYVILDDHADMLPHQQANFIHVNTLTGLTEDDAYAARKILNLP
jgi:hypothetical protein